LRRSRTRPARPPTRPTPRAPPRSRCTPGAPWPACLHVTTDATFERGRPCSMPVLCIAAATLDSTLMPEAPMKSGRRSCRTPARRGVYAAHPVRGCSASVSRAYAAHLKPALHVPACPSHRSPAASLLTTKRRLSAGSQGAWGRQVGRGGRRARAPGQGRGRGGGEPAPVLLGRGPQGAVSRTHAAKRARRHPAGAAAFGAVSDALCATWACFCVPSLCWRSVLLQAACCMFSARGGACLR